MDLGATTWTDVAAPIVVVPVGSCEQHGPHLPLHTDTAIANALARALCGHRSDCVVAPPITVSASGEHAGFPGTLSIGTTVMTDVIVELARSADWADGVVFVNGHGGNLVAMRRAAEVFERERRRVLIWWPNLPGGDLHAGRTETSLMLALAPDQVRPDRIEAGRVPQLAEVMQQGVRALSPNGVLGDPTGADPTEGHELFQRLVEQLETSVAAWVDAR